MRGSLPRSGRNERVPGRLLLPNRARSPARLLTQRMSIAIGLLALTTAIVYLDRSGYKDTTGSPLSLLDCLYYATVSLSTTGYGDIVPATPAARLVNVFVITLLRLVFLLVLVGTTLEVLTKTAREEARVRTWRRSVHDHVVIIGYGTKGRAALSELRAAGTGPDGVAVIDIDEHAVQQAADDGALAICGDATSTAVLEQVKIADAARVIIATKRDDTTVLATLTVRQLNATATVVAAVEHAENAPLLRAAGVNAVVVHAEAAGRLLGVSVTSPATGELVADLLVSGSGLEFGERPAVGADIGRRVVDGPEVVLGLVRNGVLHHYGDAGGTVVQPGDRLVTVRHVPEDATAT